MLTWREVVETQTKYGAKTINDDKDANNFVRRQSGWDRMPEIVGINGVAMSQDERIALLVSLVGGPVKAAAIIGKTRTHIDNMRRPGAPLRFDDVLALAKSAGVSLDWVASGRDVRPDLVERDGGGLADANAGGFGGLPGFARLQPLRPDVQVQGGRSLELWTPSEIAVSAQWLDGQFGLSGETARYATAGDDAMQPVVRKGAFVIVDTRPATPRTGLYLVGVGDELVVRRLSRLPGGRADLIADGDPRWRYALPAEMPDDLELYRVVWAGQAV